MNWHVRHRTKETDHVEWFQSPEEAIEAACCMMDEGIDIQGIGTESLDDSIGKDQIASIYALWAKARLRSY